MERILALQALSEFQSEPVNPVGGCSGESNACSSSSGGIGGVSTCSIGCGDAEEMDW